VGTHNERNPHPDGSPREWPDGTARSSDNGFTHGYGKQPHGYVVGGEVGATSCGRRRGPRSVVEFNVPGATVHNAGSDSAPIPRRIRRGKAVQP
jgi:hypothetical protein